MAKKYDDDDFDFIDDYYEDEEDSAFYSQVASDLSDVSYEDFNKPGEIIDDDEYDDEYDDVPEAKVTSTKKKTVQKTSAVEEKLMENEELMDFLMVFWMWFRRIGIIVAIILIAYFITKGMMKDLLLYLLLLVVAFGFGFGFMAIINKLMENR